jgi:hypothetical protein
MGGDEELRLTGANQFVHQGEQCELSLWRESRLGFVHQEQTILESILHDRQKRFAMGHLVQRSSAVPHVRVACEVA